MKIKNISTGLFLALIVLSAIGIYAQDVSKAQKAYDEWREKQARLGAKADEREILIAASVIKYENVGATVNFVIGVGEGVTKLGELEFIVQPVAIKKEKNGTLTFEDLPGGGTLKTDLSGEDDLERTGNGVISTPQLTIKMPANAGAVKITVKESSSEKSSGVTLRLTNEGTSAVLSGVLDKS